MPNGHVVLDAHETAFFNTQLRHVKSRVWQVEYPEIRFRDLLPVSNEAGPGAETIVWREYDYAGFAKIIASYADDLPRVNIKGIEHRTPVKGVGTSFGFSIQDIRAAQMAGINLRSRDAETAREVTERTHDKVAWFGDRESGLPGMFYNPNVISYVVDQDSGSNSTAWLPEDGGQKTAAEILADVETLLRKSPDLTNEVEEPDTVLLPGPHYAYLATTPRSDNSDTTLLEYLQRNHPGVAFEKLGRCRNLDEPVLGGGDTSNIMVAYARNDRKLAFEIPQEFEMFPEQLVGLEYQTPCHARTGGTVVYRPLSIAIAEGI